jgi:hypothetical protein
MKTRFPAHIPALLGLTLALTSSACGDDGPAASTDIPRDTSNSNDSGPAADTTSGNRPPELERIGDRVVAVDRTLVIVANARDPDDDPLTWSLFGNVPDGARFDKAARRFEWTPTEAGRTVFLTFMVSDGTDFDRETIRIQVVTELTENAPVFTPLGDRALPVGVPWELRLEATDPDGETVTYGHEDALPEGATLDPTSGIFAWTPSADQAGIVHEVVFLASDASASARLPLRFVVDDGRAGLALPPAFTMSKAASATAGQRLDLALGATDPNGDALTFAVLGESPSGATLAGNTWTWTPATEDAGRAVRIVFTASDGTFTAVHTVTVSVQRPAAGSCGSDPHEPNETFAEARTIETGTTDAAMCDTETTRDSDYFRLTIPAGQQLDARIDFDPALGDLDLYLLDANEDILAASEGITGTEQVAFPSAASAPVTLAVIGYSDVPLAVPYRLTTSFAPANACSDDAFAGNHSPASARAYNDNVGSAQLQLCAGKPDYWTFPVVCGQSIEILLDIGAEADLDMALYDDPTGPGTTGRAPIASAASEESLESIEIPAAARTGTHLLEVVSYPNNAVSAPYELVIDTNGGCSDDGFNNIDRATARAFPNGLQGGTVTGTLCCTNDWFAITLAAGDEVIVESTPSGGAMTMVALAPDGTTQVDTDGPRTGPGLLLFEAELPGTYFVRVSGAVGVTYTLEYGRF